MTGLSERLRLLAFASILAGIALSHPAMAEDEPGITGYWYGHDYQPMVEEFMQRITHMREDGTFTVEFRQYRNCKLADRQIESGTWQLEGNVETKFTTEINGDPADYTDHYEIIELGPEKMVKRHVEVGTVFISKRVTADFTFKECENMI